MTAQRKIGMMFYLKYIEPNSLKPSQTELLLLLYLFQNILRTEELPERAAVDISLNPPQDGCHHITLVSNIRCKTSTRQQKETLSLPQGKNIG
jgi:hypothetical protein